MFRRLLSRFVGPFGGEAEGDTEDDEAEGDAASDDSGFLPSRLDASVLYAHGMANSGAEREIANVEEKAEILEEQHREE